MSQICISEMMDECRAAVREGEISEEFIVKESLQHAYRLKIRAAELEREIQDRHTALDAELEGIYEEIKQLNETTDRILQEHVDAGTLEEAGYKVEPIIQKQNRKPDMDKIRRHEDDWNLLISLEVKRIKENYVPNQTALKAVFGRQYEGFLIPAQTVVTGYEVEPVAVMPEKAGEVEV